jgi:hypothetical protein
MKRCAFMLTLALEAAAQSLTGPASVTVGDPVFLRLTNGITPIPGVTVRVTAPAIEMGIVAAASLTFRESPAGATRGILYRGDRLLIKGQSGDGWCEVAARGGSGYVACDFLDRQSYGQPVGITDVDGRIVAPGIAVVPGRVTVAAGAASFSFEVRAAAEDTTSLLAPGITHRTRRWIRDQDGPFTMQVVEVDPREPNAFVLPMRALDRAAAREKISSMAQRYGAIAATNGAPSAPDGTSLADYQLDGQATSTSTVPRAALIRCADGSLLIDRDRTCSLKDLVSAAPVLVLDGRVNISADGFGNDRVRMPRTAFAITTRGSWLFVTVDGRQPSSPGMRLDEFATELVTLGAARAINLEGGSSTTMVVEDAVRNSPADGAERTVSDGVLVFSVHDLASLRRILDRVAADPGQVAPGAIEPIFGHYDRAVAAFAAEEVEQVRIEIEAMRGEIRQRSGGELTPAAARVLTAAADAYLRLLPGIQQMFNRRRAIR